jgi:hypothetical protein
MGIGQHPGLCRGRSYGQCGYRLDLYGIVRGCRRVDAMVGPAPPDRSGRLVGVSQHTWLRHSPGSRDSRGHGYVPGNEFGRESHGGPDAAWGCIRSCGRDLALARRQFARAGWWVPAHLLGSLVGGALGIIAFHAMGLIGFYQFSWAAAGAMFGAGFGAVTGLTLVWLLRQPISEG